MGEWELSPFCLLKILSALIWTYCTNNFLKIKDMFLEHSSSNFTPWAGSPHHEFREESPLGKKGFFVCFLIFVLCGSLIDLQCCVSLNIVS